LGIAAVGGGYETVREALDARAYPPPGQLVDVGGHRLHLQCTGSGGPTVVVEPGLGGASADLGWVTAAVARTSRICVYDRAGRGWSEPADGPQDAARIAADLHTLLDRAGVPGPYVLAGHSFGGLYVLSFAAQFPAEVAGMVLLDSTAPNPGSAHPASTESSTVPGRVSALMPAVAHLGVGRLIAQSSYDDLPPEVQDSARANGSTVRDLDSSLQEFLQGSASIQQAASLTDLGAKPLVVLTADTGSDARWQAAQQHLATLSTNSVHRHAQATHESLVGDQADSAAASQAIVDVVFAVRASQPLAGR
jgi:pimeloyl-ACP methyl ester carboxylesterase